MSSGDDGDRPRRSWSEIDRLREKGRSGPEHEPRGRHARARARRATEAYVKQLDSLFTHEPGGGPAVELANAVREAHGSDRAAEACRAYRDAIGHPRDGELVTIFLDSGDPQLVVGALDAALEASRAGDFAASPGLRRQLGMLAEDFDDAVASRAEELLEGL